MKYYFPIHLNGDNRGCEGIAKGTAKILDSDKSNLIGLCTNVNLDKKLGIGNLITLVHSKKETLLLRLTRRLLRIFSLTELSQTITYRYHFDSFLNKMDQNDILISTGGDMMCYGNNQVNYTTDFVSNKKIKSILWGCSIGEKNLTPEKLETLKRFSLIYARESLTRDVLLKYNIKNVVVYPDPAFILESIPCKLPLCFKEGDVIGINLSNYTIGGYTLNTPFGEEIKILINYIISNTNLRILLIPHVIWEGQDDRIICKIIKDHYNSNRISSLNISELNYLEIRFIISKCRFFIGARTHAMISAYSTKVPSIAIGYSIKSVGIAKDLYLSDQLVVDSRNITKGKLLSSFEFLLNNEEAIHTHLNNFIEKYKSRIWDIRNDIKKLQ